MISSADDPLGSLRPACVIVNPSAGKRGVFSINRYTIEDVERSLTEVGLPYELITPECREKTAEVAKTAVESGCRLIVAAGGDGTVSDVASQLLGTSCVLGILPLGSVMNVARALGVPRDIDEAARILTSGTERQMDVGEINGSIFLEGIMIGLSAEVVQPAVTEFETGFTGVPLQILRYLLSYSPIGIRLTVDGQKMVTRAMVITISNGPYTGLAFTLDPAATVDDQRLNLAIYRDFSKWELLRHFGSISFGRRRYHPEIIRLTGKQIHIETEQPMSVRVDGNDHGTTPVDVRILPKALRVIANREEAALTPKCPRTVEQI